MSVVQGVQEVYLNENVPPQETERSEIPLEAASGGTEVSVKELVPIVFGVATEDDGPSLKALEEERAKHQSRAQKFGVDFVEPKKELALTRAEIRTEIARQRAKNPSGFATGIDLFSQEEEEKRISRAKKYGVPVTTPILGGRQLSAEVAEKLTKRAERFGKVDVPPPTDDADFMEADLLEPRTDVSAGTTLRPDTIHVYGTDQMSTREVLSYFDGYGPGFVDWVNDSCCNVVFADAFSAKRALLGVGTPETSHAGQGDAQVAPWHKGQLFFKGQLGLPLSLRIASVNDVKPVEGVKSRRLWGEDGHVARPPRRKARRIPRPVEPPEEMAAEQLAEGAAEEAGQVAEDGEAAVVAGARSKRKRQKAQAEGIEPVPAVGGGPGSDDASDLRSYLARKGTAVSDGIFLGEVPSANGLPATSEAQPAADAQEPLQRRGPWQHLSIKERLGVSGGKVAGQFGGEGGVRSRLGPRVGEVGRRQNAAPGVRRRTEGQVGAIHDAHNDRWTAEMSNDELASAVRARGRFDTQEGVVQEEEVVEEEEEDEEEEEEDRRNRRRKKLERRVV